MDDTTTDRCESCGHPRDAWCDDECCWWKGERWLETSADQRRAERITDSWRFLLGEVRRGIQ